MHLTYRICFVCLGNICRSPMAEVVTRSLLDDAGLADRITVSSAGTGNWHVGRSADPGSVRALAARGYDGSRHRAEQLTIEKLADYDLLVGLDTANVIDIEALFNKWGFAERPEVRLLRDYTLRDDALRDDAPRDDALRDDAPHSAPGLGVPDPYGLGDDAFDHALDLVEEACAGLVEGLKEDFRTP